MKRSGIALALAVLALLLTACGAGRAGDTDVDSGIRLPYGYYSVHDPSITGGSGKVGYLKVTYSRLTFYDALGNDLESVLYDMADSVIYAGGAALYTVTEEKTGFLLSASGGTKYHLEYLSADLLPEGGYAVYAAANNEKLGYLRVADGELIFYDADGAEMERRAFRVSEEGVVTSGGQPIYSAKYGWGGLRLTNADGREYLLVESDSAPK